MPTPDVAAARRAKAIDAHPGGMMGRRRMDAARPVAWWEISLYGG